MAKRAGKNTTAKFKSGAAPVINGGRKAIAEGKSKARGATRTPIGKRR